MQDIYQPKKIEPIVQMHWHREKTFIVKEDFTREKYYCLSMLPYPSGHLHIGHVRNYTIGDVISRYQRLLGKNVLQPIGWDAFGLPAERAAIQHNTAPATWTYSNISHMKKQLQSLGFAYDWSRELITCHPKYYKWEQWFFIALYKKGLIYKKTTLVNWCPKDKTVLANEQVINNSCWRCNTKIEYKKMPQWFIKITKYADQLLNDLNILKDWPEQVKTMQRNWIGRSNGIEISFKILDSSETVVIYTTRPDTFMGVTYLAIAIDHPLAIKAAGNNLLLRNYLKKCQKYQISEANAHSTNVISGIDTNMYAAHPLTGTTLPIWISNRVLTKYGTGAIMGVPAHNQEDWKFANQNNLPIKPVILDISNKKPNVNFKAMIHKGQLFNSKEFSGLNHHTACRKISEHLIKKGIAKYKTHYRIQDWSISRQRYWGAPIPIITLKNGNIVPVPTNQLPVILPEDIKIDNITNALNVSSWKHTIYKNSEALRETDTFDTFVESSWYYARYTCPNYKDGMLSSSAANYWLPIDQYIGGIEHATMHLIYFRFYHKLMRDFGLVQDDEPAKRLLCQGMVLSDAFYYLNNKNEQIWISPSNVQVKRDKDGNIIQATDLDGNNLIHFGMVKMSKSKNNGVDVDFIIKKYGADTARLSIMFAAPANMPLEWKETNVDGAHRFLNRLWKLVYEHVKHGPTKILNTKTLNHDQKILRKKVHKTILKVTDDIDRRQMFNTAIASIMELVNHLTAMVKKDDTEQGRALLHEALLIIVRILYPFTPHITFFLWKALGASEDIDNTNWPIADKTALIEHTKKIIVYINGKMRHKMTVLKNVDERSIIQNILLEKKSYISQYLQNKKILKTIYIPNKLINLVVEE